ncbi:MAG: biopolymer transporter ExbD [Flavobacteriales bacterium]|nr:biopolymer transporter ExbD [Flavobacteriales bacterium]MCB9167318.1 biopolymer transporter ExbD [Flavobacteriales bacterium]
MSRFKDKSNKGTPAISTASLPDIIFMLLFFFMVTTVMREVDLKVKVTLPEASEVDKLEDKALVDYIYIGPPVSTSLGTEPLIQLNDQYAKLDEIGPWVKANNDRRQEAEVPRITRSLKVDKDTHMKIVTDVKQELRKSNALKINYSTARGRE